MSVSPTQWGRAERFLHALGFGAAQRREISPDRPDRDQGFDESYRLPGWAKRTSSILIFSLLPPLLFWATAAGAWRAMRTDVATETKFVDILAKGAWTLVCGGFFYAVGALGAALLILMASVLVGGAFGFLFGLPRMEPRVGQSVERDRLVATGAGASTSGEPPRAEAGEPVQSPRSGTSDASPRAERDRMRTDFRMSPALNEIADWLTKIIVGLGLVQASNIGTGFGSVINFLLHDAGLGRFPAAGVVVPACIIIGLIGGFMLTYLAMALLVGPQLARAADDLETVAELKDQAKRARDNMKAEALLRAKAEEQTQWARERAQVVDTWRKFDLLALLSRRPHQPAPDVDDAARRFAELDFKDCDTLDEKLAWAKINAALGRNDRALKAYEAL